VRAIHSTRDAPRLGMLLVSSIDLRRQAIASLLAAIKYLPLEERQGRVEELGSAVSRDLPRDLMMTAGSRCVTFTRAAWTVGAHTGQPSPSSQWSIRSARASRSGGQEPARSDHGRPGYAVCLPERKSPAATIAPSTSLVKQLGFERRFHRVGRRARGERSVPVAALHCPGTGRRDVFLLRLDAEHVSHGC